MSDASRLAALRSYNLLDTPPEPQFDDVVQLARTICRAPVALVSLVAADRQWFKARAGIDLVETPLDESVCVHAIKERELLVVPDLTLDPRTRDNPLVTGPPHIRFYAGAVLRAADGEALGALCVIDTVPRPDGLSGEQTASLLALARQTMVLLHYRRAAGAEHAQEAGGVGTFEIDVASGTLFPSPEFCRIFGLPPLHSIDADKVEVLVLSEDRAQISNTATRRTGDAVLEVQYRIHRPMDGALRWVARRGEFERDGTGRALRFSGMVQDITERKHLEAEQQTLNEELSHRMKNTLAMVDAIATQTLRHAADQPAVVAFGRRIQALARAHDVLLGRAMAGASVRATIAAVVGVIADAARFDLAGPDVDIGTRSVLSFSLLVHELTTNAVKYGALSRDGGRVSVMWRTQIDDSSSNQAPVFVLEWRERGGPTVVPPERRGFGSRLIASGLSGTGRSEVRYLTDGVSAEFRAPLAFVSG